MALVSTLGWTLPKRLLLCVCFPSWGKLFSWSQIRRFASLLTLTHSRSPAPSPIWQVWEITPFFKPWSHEFPINMKVLWFSCTTNNCVSFLACLTSVCLCFLLCSCPFSPPSPVHLLPFSLYSFLLFIPSSSSLILFQPRPSATPASLRFNRLIHSFIILWEIVLEWKAHFISSKNDQPTNNQIAILCP